MKLINLVFLNRRIFYIFIGLETYGWMTKLYCMNMIAYGFELDLIFICLLKFHTMCSYEFGFQEARTGLRLKLIFQILNVTNSL